MTVKAFVLMEVEVGKTDEVLAAVRGIEGIKEAHSITGPYDVIAVTEAADLSALSELITKKIHALAGITRTMTCLAILG